MTGLARSVPRSLRAFAILIGLWAWVPFLWSQTAQPNGRLGAAIPGAGKTGDTRNPGAVPPVPAARALYKVTAPAIAPGAVGSAAVTVPQYGNLFRYRIDPASGVKIFGDLTGMVKVDVGEQPIVPLAYATPHSALAGLLQVATVTVEWGDGSRWAAEVESRVEARPRINLMVRPDREEVAPGGGFVLHYTILNLGNSPDTVQLRVEAQEGWEVEQPRPLTLLKVGQRVSGTLRVRVPHSVASGEVGMVRLYAQGRGNTADATATVRITRGAGLSDEIAWVPARLYFGTTVLDPTPGLAGALGLGFEAGGKLSNASDFSLSYHPASQWTASPALASVVGGARFRASFRHSGFRATLGNVFTPGRDLTGFSTDGQGVQLQWDRGAFSMEGTFARPRTYDATQPEGHVAEALVGARTPVGRIGLSIFDREQSLYYGAGAGHLQGAGVRYEVPRVGGQHGHAEAGMVRMFTEDGQEVVAPVITGAYSVSGRLGGIWTHLRNVNSDQIARAVAPGIASAGASLVLLRGLSVSGSAHTNDFGFAGDSAARTEGATAGARLDTRWFETHVTGRFHRSSPLPGAELLEDRHSISTALSLPLGALNVQGEVEQGIMPVQGVEHPYSTYRTSLRWTGSANLAWLGLSYMPNNGTSSPTWRADMNTSLQLGPLEFRSGGGTSLGNGARLAENLNLWSGLTLELFRNTAIMVGADYLPAAAADVPWRISLGVQRKFSLPLPIPTPTSISGVVFDDLDGNGKQDPGEPGVQGVRLTLGALSVVSDANGHFAFRSEVGPSALRVDAATLPSPLIRDPGTPLGNSRRVIVPLLRPASLLVELRVDERGKSDETLPPAEGSIAELSDRQGRVYPGVADASGRMTFSALAPGEYELVFWMPAPQGVRPERKTVRLTLKPGEQRQLTERVPLRRREVRMRVAEPVEDAPQQESSTPRNQEAGDPGASVAVERGTEARRRADSRGRPAEAPAADRKPPLEEASQVYQRLLHEVPAPAGVPDFRGAMHRFEVAYATRYADAGYADQVRGYLAEMMRRVAPSR